MAKTLNVQLPFNILESKIELAARKFDAEHPEVFVYILAECREWRLAGGDEWSIKGVFERLRWAQHFGKFEGEEWKLNNNYTAYYARKVNLVIPGIFETRTLRAEVG